MLSTGRCSRPALRLCPNHLVIKQRMEALSSDRTTHMNGSTISCDRIIDIVVRLIMWSLTTRDQCIGEREYLVDVLGLNPVSSCSLLWDGETVKWMDRH